MEAAAPTRTRSVSWEDPARSARQGLELSGLEYIRAIRDGEVANAPIAELLGFDLSEADEGRVVFECEPGEHHYNPMNAVHGGLALTLLDSATGAAVHTTLLRGQLYSTLEIKINLVRPMTSDTGRVLAAGRVLHRGSSIVTSEGRLTAADSGKLLAHGTATCMILGG